MGYLRKIGQEIRKKWVLLLLCIGIVFGCWFALLKHYQSYDKANSIVSKLENKILDLKFLIRGPQAPKGKVGILAIDEKSLEQFGRWPFSRKYYSQAFRNLKELGVRWIGIDAVFSEQEIPTIGDIEPYLQDLEQSIQKKFSKPEIAKNLKNKLKEIESLNLISPGDRILADGISDFSNIILGYFYFQSKAEVEFAGLLGKQFRGFDIMADSAIGTVIMPEGRELDSYSDALKAYGVVGNTEIISKAGSHFAFFSNEADSDAIIRWVSQVKIINGALMPSLSLKLAAESLNREIVVFMDNEGIEAIELVNRDNEDDTFRIPTDPLGMGRVLVNHRGPRRSFSHFSLADAYNNSFSNEEKKALKNSVLLLGMTAIGINDQRPNPFDPSLDGVENHAAVVDNIISKDFIQRPISIYNIEKWIIILIGLIFVPILLFSRASLSGLLAAVFIVGYYYFDKYYWFGRGIWAYVGMPFFEIITLFITVTLYKYMTEEQEKKKVKGAFSHYLSPEVINQVLDNPESLQLGGVRKELTVFFSDVRGFTTISETLSPEQLCEFMNTYFTPMTNIILRSGGVLDKYIGDAVMAFWGAPIPIMDQADRAADASIQMLVALDRLQEYFKERGFPRCDIGIGLNTGLMSVGNMGSDERFCYTVMGDAVNLGARLEGLTKEYGIKILISEFTVNRFTQKHHLYRDLDDIRVKGKNEPVKVFDLIRPDVLPREQEIRDLIGLFEEGRGLYRQQRWEEASKKFQECLRIKADDGPSLTYIKRIKEYMPKPKIVNWDGVYTFTHK